MSAEEKKKKTKTPQERLAEALAEAEADEAIERIEKMSDEEIEKDLVEAGFDMDEERERFRKLLVKHGVLDDEKDEKKGDDVVPIAKAAARRRGGTAWIGLAVAAVVLAAVAWQWSKREVAPTRELARPEPPPTQPAPSATTTPLDDTRDRVASPPPRSSADAAATAGPR